MRPGGGLTYVRIPDEVAILHVDDELVFRRTLPRSEY